MACVWYTKNCHLKFKWSNVFGCQWFIPWLVDAIHQSSFQWSKSGLYCSQMTSIQMWVQTPPTSGFEPAKKSTLWSIIKNLIWKFRLISRHQIKNWMLCFSNNKLQKSFKLYFHEFLAWAIWIPKSKISYNFTTIRLFEMPSILLLFFIFQQRCLTKDLLMVLLLLL